MSNTTVPTRKISAEAIKRLATPAPRCCEVHLGVWLQVMRFTAHGEAHAELAPLEAALKLLRQAGLQPSAAQETRLLELRAHADPQFRLLMAPVMEQYVEALLAFAPEGVPPQEMLDTLFKVVENARARAAEEAATCN